MEATKQKINHLWQVSGPYHALIFFIAGFLFDIFTLEEVDDLLTIISQMVYLIVATSLFLITTEGYKLSNFLPDKPWAFKISEFEEDIFHFALGALLNAFTLYFFKSGTFFNSMIFLVFLSSLLLLNEFRPSFLKHDLIPAILLHTCFISFTVILAPTLLGKMGTLPFLLGVACYLLIIFAWIKIRRGRFLAKSQVTIAACLAIFFILMYVFRLFPPVPLSLKKIGIYHKIEKMQTEDGTRYLAFSSSPWWHFWSDTSTPYMARPDDALHVFTRVFAPAGFADTVYIEWWWKAPNKWLRSDRIPLTITGGRRDGFRGFAYKNNYDEGEWKVLITTSDGLEIGRTYFEVSKVPQDYPITLNSKAY
tara:strand:- start:7014 stop:8105 length:1092 start_codon:yes stop_codon:yes gene_type:complete